MAEPRLDGNTLSPALADCEAQYEAIEESIGELVEGLSDEQLMWRPGGGRAWSICECFDHLNEVGYKYLSRFDREIAAARSAGRTGGEGKVGFLARFMARSMEPPYRMKMKAPGSMQPNQADQPRKVIRELIELQGELIKRLRDAEGLDLRSIRVVSPVTKLIRFNYLEWQYFLAAHERRHVWQATQVRAAEGFPAG